MKKNDSYRRSISNNYSSSSLSVDSELDVIRQTSELKEIIKLNNVVTNNIKNKYKCNYFTEYDPKFADKFCLSSGTEDPLPVVTARL